MSFIELNALAEDMRIVDDVPGVDTVIRDLKNAQKCRSAWHVIRTAALFARGAEALVTLFLKQSSDIIPDFILILNGSEIAVEAKILGKSDVEDRFEKYGTSLINCLFDEINVNNRIWPMIFVVIKDSDTIPETNDIVACIDRMIKIFDGHPVETRSEHFNIFLRPHHTHITHAAYQFCMVLCPRSPRENLRVESRAKMASKQLRADVRADRPGLFCLELGRHEDPHYVASVLARRFSNSQYRGISSLMLSRSGVHLSSPQRAVIQYLGTLHNPAAIVPCPPKLKIAPVGLMGRLLEAFPKSSNIPAYRVSECVATVASVSSPGIWVPEVRVLTPEMLA